MEGANKSRQWLVKWKNCAAEDATWDWEDEFLLRSQFPNLNLEDKAAPTGEVMLRVPWAWTRQE